MKWNYIVSFGYAALLILSPTLAEPVRGFLLLPVCASVGWTWRWGWALALAYCHKSVPLHINLLMRNSHPYCWGLPFSCRWHICWKGALWSAGDLVKWPSSPHEINKMFSELLCPLTPVTAYCDLLWIKVSVCLLQSCKKRLWERKVWGGRGEKKREIDSYLQGKNHLIPVELWYNNSSPRAMGGEIISYIQA